MPKVVKVDNKGRIIIPKDLREKAGIKDLVSITMHNDHVAVYSEKDPFDEIAESVRIDVKNIRKEAVKLSKIAEKELEKVLARSANRK
jgi:AbrB family looped-hinge helix DNA binding protein